MSALPSSGFLRREGRYLVDGSGERVLLTGVGLGNWWLPEGYMWRFGTVVASPRQIEDFVADLIGAAEAAEFWSAFRRDYVGESDVRAWAALGWNSVRLPLNSRYLVTDQGEFIEASFAIIDTFIEQCRTHGIYVIIDLHGAPGGQTGTNIDDSPNGLPELFTDEKHQQLTIELWREIARRYRDDPIIGGYDLLNEPLPHEYQYRYPDELVSLYRRLIEVIREEDPHHLIILEGTHWARNWSIFDQLWDENVLLQFHKYWNSPDRTNIQQYLDRRERLDVPIYMGEGGENNLAWYQGSFEMYEQLDISWNFWTWKKNAKENSPARILEPEGWQKIVDFALGEGPRPDRDLAREIFREYVANVVFERCEFREDVVNAVNRTAPLRIEAEHFGYLGDGISSFTYHPTTPLPGFREGDAVTVVYAVTGTQDGPVEPNFRHNHGRPRAAEEELAIVLEPRDWTRYGFTLTRESPVTLTVVPGAASGRGAVRIELDGHDVGVVEIPGGTPVSVPTLPAGRHEFRLIGDQGPVLIDAIDVVTR